MRFLIVEDEPVSRQIMEEILTPLGECDTAVNGEEAIQKFKTAIANKQPYDMTTMDIMMPGINGQQALRSIRSIEKEAGVKSSAGVKVIMTTALGDQKNVIEAFYKGGALAYLVKPIKRKKLFEEMRNMGFSV